MRIIFTVLFLAGLLIAKDNFVFQSYNPKLIDQRLSSIEKELRSLKQSVDKKQTVQIIEKKQAPKPAQNTKITNNIRLEYKNLQKQQSTTKQQINKLEKELKTLQKSLKALQTAQKAPAKTTTRIITKSVSDKETALKLQALSKKLSQLEEDFKTYQKPSNTEIKQVKKEPSQYDKAFEAYKKRTNSSGTLQATNEKVKSLEKRINSLEIDIAANQGLVTDYAILIHDPKIQYVLVGIAIFLFLVLFIAISASSKAARASKNINKLSEILSRSGIK